MQYVPVEVSEDCPVQPQALRLACAIPVDDDSHDASLTALALQFISRIENELGILLREQSGQFTECTPDRRWITTTGETKCESIVPVRVSNVVVDASVYYNGTDFESELDVELPSSRLIQWIQPSDVEYGSIAYKMDVSLSPLAIGPYLAGICNAVTLMYIRSDHPDLTLLLQRILNTFALGL